MQPFKMLLVAIIAPCLLLGIVGPPSMAHGEETAPSGDAEKADDEALSERERKILELVKNRDPEVKVDEVDMDRLRVRRIDVVDDNNVIRMTIAGVLPDPVVDGVQYKRSMPVSGIMVRDNEGNERGGFGFNSNLDGPLIALDHPTGEGAGLAIREDGTAMSFLGAAKEPLTSKEMDGALLPGGTGKPKSHVVTKVGPDGRPSIALTDKQGRPRVRITLTEQGYGAIEFVDAEGNVVETRAPEREQAQSK